MGVGIALVAQRHLMRSENEAIGIETRHMLLLEPLPLKGVDLFGQPGRDLARNIILEFKDVLERAVIMLGPDGPAAIRLEQLDANPHLAA